MRFTYIHWKYFYVLLFIIMTTKGRQTSAHIRDASISDSMDVLETRIQGTSMSSFSKVNTINYIFYKIIKYHIFLY